MNDFTKEELIMIRVSIQDTIIKNDPWENAALLSIHRRLKHKIQRMIYNYCEHDPQGDWHVCVDKCTKCGVICE